MTYEATPILSAVQGLGHPPALLYAVEGEICLAEMDGGKLID